eukprot:scaffold22698_cov203-Skeletonema_marinoi.AAC.1
MDLPQCHLFQPHASSAPVPIHALSPRTNIGLTSHNMYLEVCMDRGAVGPSVLLPPILTLTIAIPNLFNTHRSSPLHPSPLSLASVSLVVHKDHHRHSAAIHAYHIDQPE